MKRFYSQSTGCTYLPSIHGKDIPADAVEISEERYQSVIANPAPGKIRSHDSSGLPVLIDPPPSSSEHLAASARGQRDAMLAKCDFTQLPDAPGDKQAWAEYRQALRDITEQEGFPMAIEWPEKPQG